MNERAGGSGGRTRQCQKPCSFARSGEVANRLRCGAEVDGGSTRGFVGVGDVGEGVVAADGKRTCAALIQGDVGVGNAATCEGLG